MTFSPHFPSPCAPPKNETRHIYEWMKKERKPSHEKFMKRKGFVGTSGRKCWKISLVWLLWRHLSRNLWTNPTNVMWFINGCVLTWNTNGLSFEIFNLWKAYKKLETSLKSLHFCQTCHAAVTLISSKFLLLTKSRLCGLSITEIIVLTAKIFRQTDSQTIGH